MASNYQLGVLGVVAPVVVVAVVAVAVVAVVVVAVVVVVVVDVVVVAVLRHKPFQAWLGLRLFFYGPFYNKIKF